VNNDDKFRLQYIIVILLVQSVLLLLTTSWKEIDLLIIPFGKYMHIILFIVIGLSVLSIILIRDLYKMIKEQAEDKIKQVKIEEKERLIKELRSQKHDFSNHLQTISGMLQLDKIDEARQYINSLNRDLKNIKEVKEETGKTILSSILLPMKQEAEEKGIKFNYQMETGVKEVTCSLNKLFRIISNLVENAIEATQDYEGEQIIEVKGNNKQEIYIISIYNRGPVISREQREKIFEPGISTKGEDRGFGLYIIKSLVEKNGGRLELKNKLGYGNQFICYLPKN